MNDRNEVYEGLGGVPDTRLVSFDQSWYFISKGQMSERKRKGHPGIQNATCKGTRDGYIHASPGLSLLQDLRSEQAQCER